MQYHDPPQLRKSAAAFFVCVCVCVCSAEAVLHLCMLADEVVPEKVGSSCPLRYLTPSTLPQMTPVRSFIRIVFITSTFTTGLRGSV